MDNSFKLVDYIDSVGSKITNNKGLYNIFMNPLYISISMTIVIIIICFMSISNSQNIKVYLKISFYTIIFLTIIELLRNSVLKKFYVSKYSNSQSDALVSDINYMKTNLSDISPRNITTENMYFGGDEQDTNL